METRLSVRVASGLSGLKMAGHQAWARGCPAGFTVEAAGLEARGNLLPGAGKDGLHRLWACEGLVDRRIIDLLRVWTQEPAA